MSSIEDLNWLQPHWRGLKAYLDADRVPQALLIVGKEGVGKTRLAEAFSRRLLCRQPGEYACGTCASCHLYAAGTHPDFIRIEPPEPGKVIPVDAIRGLISNLGLKPQYAGRRVVLITPAHQMNASSANSLLKTLEEPDEHTTLLLLTDSPQSLLPTIVSRCQRLDIPIPERATVRAWLKQKGQGARADVLCVLAHGAPLRALAMASDGMMEKREEFFSAWSELPDGSLEPVSVADKWSKFPSDALIDWMLSWTMDMIKLRSAPSSPGIDNPDLRERLQALSQKLNLQQLFFQLDHLNEARKMMKGQINRQLLLEELLIRWQRGHDQDATRQFP